MSSQNENEFWEEYSQYFLNDSLEFNNDFNCCFQTESTNIFPSLPNILEDTTNIILNRIILPEQNPEPKRSKHDKHLGRKRKEEASNDSNECEHTKYSEDNMTKKFKVHFRDALLDIINSEIQEINKKNKIIVNIEGKKYKVKQLLKIAKEPIIDNTVENTKKLLNDKLKNIFSIDIAGNYKKYPKCFNKAAINKLYELENNEKIVNILEMTFLDCLQYYRKDKKIIKKNKYSCLKGLDKHFDDLSTILKNKDSSIKEDYTNDFIQLIKDFENIYEDKTERKKRK